MSEMSDIFIKQTPAQVVNLKRFQECGDFSVFVALANKVKPTFAMVGFPSPGELLETIIGLARSGGPFSIPSLKALMEKFEGSANLAMEIAEVQKSYLDQMRNY